MCQDPTRRALILTALATGACLASSSSSVAEEDLPGSNERPQKADVLVFSEGERAGEVIKPQDLKAGGPPVRAWPKDPKTSVVRKGSRLNEVLVVRLDPAELDEETRSRAADGIVAYSAICTHTGCPITAWVKAAGGDKDVFKCVCHNSEYRPAAKRASRVRTGAPASAGTSVGGRRRLAHGSRNICWKGRCTAGQGDGGAADRSTTMKNRIREMKTNGRLRLWP